MLLSLNDSLKFASFSSTVFLFFSLLCPWPAHCSVPGPLIIHTKTWTNSTRETPAQQKVTFFSASSKFSRVSVYCFQNILLKTFACILYLWNAETSIPRIRCVMELNAQSKQILMKEYIYAFTHIINFLIWYKVSIKS